MNSIEKRLAIITEYCDNSGIPYTVNRNPSKSEKNKLQESFKDKEEVLTAVYTLHKRSRKPLDV